ncbi:hypothetical protein EAH57_00240 [Acinetobacter sp. 2JN-4]|uniref:hypothetical protein n=1 Tax=Acinetobacter sp. 2JN-4 TaxID=2479844 RepID=UPI000EFA291F|nr:hypothetical protein [Acinetobacter sp. 2JN-4]RLZ10851.1 hypothetical protein EAH57_00240 [Acinetobacter sp. 2JN-4]
MTSLTIHLPDELVKKAEQAGLLESEELAKLLEQALQAKNENRSNTGFGMLKSNKTPVPVDFDVASLLSK